MTTYEQHIQDTRQALKNVIDKDPSSVPAQVAKEALKHDNPESFFIDIQDFGCTSGMVNSLVYRYDTHAFFEQHYTYIEALRHEVEQEYGQPLEIKGDLKNFLAWFAFEETAIKLYDELFE